MKTLSIVAMTLSLLIYPAFAEVAVVVHPSNSNSLDTKAISRIFTGKMKSFPDGTQVVAVNQASGSDVSKEFNSKVLKKSASQLKAYWSKLVFTGKGSPPREVADDAAVIELVANNPNIIGYVNAASADGSVKVASTF